MQMIKIKKNYRTETITLTQKTSFDTFLSYATRNNHHLHCCMIHVPLRKTEKYKNTLAAV
jgi:hypothetical protein